MPLDSLVRLSEVGAGPRRYIEVPSIASNLLHTYLWSNSIQTSLPMPHGSGFDRIELDESVDLERIQHLLSWWA